MNERNKVSRSTLEKESLIEIESEKIEMTLNTDNAIASGLLIQRLTELYEDPVEASVRETISNALDAVTESYDGKYPEIHITSPSTLNPVFTVQDNGVGMSYEDLKNVYSKYGASTKMNDMEQIGAYGLGAKAPLAYGTEFTVSSVKDGEFSTIIVAREEMTNYIKVIETGSTDKPNGTTVSIPVNSYDINRFREHIEGYRENPVDKDVVIFIDEEEVKESDYIEVTREMVIFDNGFERVTSRLWIKNDPDNIVSLIDSASDEDIRQSVKYLIGGWAYQSPSGRNSYMRRNYGLMVELKAGIVGFNSSRDAILENDRYSRLEDKVSEYVSSNQFMTDLTKTINSLHIDNFRSIIVSLMKRNERNIMIKNGNLEVEDINRNHWQTYITRNYSISDFVHDETGYTFNHIIEGVPSVSKPTAAIAEHKVSYRKTPYNSISDSYDTDGIVRHRGFSDANLADIIKEVEDIIHGSYDSHSLESLMINLMLQSESRSKSDVTVTFITDVNTDDDENTRTFTQLRSGRKTIVRLRTGDAIEGTYSSFTIYTKHSKADIEKMIETARLDNLDIMIETADVMVEKLREYRRKNRTARKSTVNQNLSTALQKFSHHTKASSRVTVQDIDKNEKNIIIVSRDRFPRSSDMSSIHAWYCNEHDVEPEDINLYSSVGQHRVVDLEILKELGDMYQHPNSQAAGTSKLYNEVVGENIAGMHIINENTKDVEKKSFLRLIAGLTGRYPSAAVKHISEVIDEAEKVANFMGLEIAASPRDILEEWGEFGDEEFGTSYAYSDWRLEKSAIKHLLTLIDEDKHEIIEDIVSFATGNRHVIKKDGTVESTYMRGMHTVDVNYLKEVCDEENSDKLYYKMMKTQAEAYVDYIDSIIQELSAIKF